MVLAQKLKHVHGKLFALDDSWRIRVGLLKRELLELLDKLGVWLLFAVKLAQDLCFTSEEVHWLIHVEQLLESDLHLADIFESQLLKVFLWLPSVKEQLFKEKTRQSSGRSVCNLSSLNRLHKALIESFCTCFSGSFQLRLSLLSCLIVGWLEVLEQDSHLSTCTSLFDHCLIDFLFLTFCLIYRI